MTAVPSEELEPNLDDIEMFWTRNIFRDSQSKYRPPTRLSAAAKRLMLLNCERSHNAALMIGLSVTSGAKLARTPLGKPRDRVCCITTIPSGPGFKPAAKPKERAEKKNSFMVPTCGDF